MATATAHGSVEIDEAKKEAFCERMLELINDAGLSLMISIGHRAGLFDAMRDIPPATSIEIANIAGLDERYVREWLGAMTAGSIIDFETEVKKFSLPPEHAAWLTRAASPNNIATTTQWISVLGQVEDQILEKFKTGGGVPYSYFCGFHRAMAEESDQTTIGGLEEHILALVPGLIDKLDSGIKVGDVGCGSGRAMIHLAGRFPKSQFVGYDFSEEGIGNAKAEAKAKGLTNASFKVADAAKLDVEGEYDLMTAFDAIHDQVEPDTVLANIARALKPDGCFLMQDIGLSSHYEKNTDHPLGAFIYAISCMHCMTVSLSAGGAGLGAAWGTELAEKMLGEAGFKDVSINRLEHDLLNAYFVARKQ